MPGTNLKVTLIPVDIKPGDAPANIDYIEGCIASLSPDTDLAVLPEMCNTGYTVDTELVERYAETADGYSLTRLREIAARYDIAIWGTITATDSGRFFNRGFMIDPSGKTEYYDKRHLFVLGREPMLYTPGETEAPIVEYKGWKLKMAICYDLRFPVWNRRTESQPYDVLIVPANWPDARSFAWRSLLVARAIENQAYIIGCNRLGSDPYGDYSLRLSYIFNQWGSDVADRSVPGIISAVFDGEALDRDRQRFPNLAAADRFRIMAD